MKPYKIFRSTTGIQSGPDAFNKSKFVMIFLTILGVTEMLCSFGLVLEEKMQLCISSRGENKQVERSLSNQD